MSDLCDFYGAPIWGILRHGGGKPLSVWERPSTIVSCAQYILLPGKICWMKSLLKAMSNNTAVGVTNRRTVVMHIWCLQFKFFLWSECNYYITGENNSYAPWSWEMHGVRASACTVNKYTVWCG